MAKDVIARLKADTSHWDSGMAKATRSLNNFQKQNMSTDAVLKMGIGTLTKFASVTAVAGAAVEGFRKYMASTEATADALAQAQRTMTTVTNEFFRSLNDGNFSSFISGLDDIISRAQNAYQALDELGSFAARYAPKNAVDLQQIDALMKQARAAKAKGDTAEAERLINEARQVAEQAKKTTLAYGEKEAKAGFSVMREKLGAPFRNASEKQLAWYADPANWEEINRNAKEYQRQLDRINDLTQKASLGTTDEQLQNMRFYGKGEAVERIRQARRELEQAQKEFDKIKGKGLRAQTYLNTRDDGEEGQDFINAHQQIYGRQRAQFAIDAIQARIDRQDAMTTGGTHASKAGKAEDIVPEGSIAEAEAKIRSLQDEWRNATSQDLRNSLTEQIREANEQLDIMKGKVQEVKVPEMATGFSGVTTAAMGAWSSDLQKQMANTDMTTPLYTALQSQLADTTALSNLLSVAFQNGMTGLEIQTGAEGLWEKLLNGENIPDDAWQRLVDEINEQLIALDLQPIKLNVQTGNLENVKDAVGGIDKNVKGAAASFSALGSAMSQIEDPGAKVAGYIASAIGQTASAYGIAQVQAAEQGGPWAWIAFAATGLATMIATITGIKSATAGAYAEGGFINSNSYMGDATPILANAGEYVMNQNELGAVAGMVQSATENSGGSAQPYVRGADIYLGFNNYLKSSGRGEIVTTKSR